MYLLAANFYGSLRPHCSGIEQIFCTGSFLAPHFFITYLVMHNFYDGNEF